MAPSADQASPRGAMLARPPHTSGTDETQVFMARVVGEVISTHRHPNLAGRKLLLVRRTGLDGTEEGVELIALDVIGVGVGEHVLVVQEGNAARTLFGDPHIPAQAVVVGVIDSYDVGGAAGPPVGASA